MWSTFFLFFLFLILGICASLWIKYSCNRLSVCYLYKLQSIKWGVGGEKIWLAFKRNANNHQFLYDTPNLTTLNVVDLNLVSTTEFLCLFRLVQLNYVRTFAKRFQTVFVVSLSNRNRQLVGKL